jgi:fructokinase
MPPTPHLRLGVDLGGTKIESAVLELLPDAPDSYVERARRRVDTQQQLGYEAIIENAKQLVLATAREASVNVDDLSIGVGMPGGTRRDGLVKNSNTVCLNGRPFRQDLVRALGRPIAFENDANCFALAETWFGAASAHRSGVVFGVIMGTGVGGGIVVNGQPWTGPMGIAGEWGHHTVYAVAPDAALEASQQLRPCYCGKRGCVEVYVSGPAVERDYARRAGASLSMADIFARRASDPAARAACDVFFDAFARGLANVVDVLDPSAIVLGGGLSNIDSLYTEGVQRIAALVFNDELTTPILRPKLGDSAGVIGAALLPPLPYLLRAH